MRLKHTITTTLCITMLAFAIASATTPETSEAEIASEASDTSEVVSEEIKPSEASDTSDTSEASDTSKVVSEEIKPSEASDTSKVVSEEIKPNDEKEAKNDSKDIKFGLRVAFNMHQYYEDDFYPAMTMGYGGGVVVKYPLMSNLNIYSELALYFRQICDHEEFLDNGSQGTYVAYEYAISIPVLLQYSPMENFYIAAGAQLDVPRWAMKETNGVGEDITELRRFDAGLVLGLGYMITPNIGVDLRGIMVMSPFVEIEGKVYGKLKHYEFGATYFF